MRKLQLPNYDITIGRIGEEHQRWLQEQAYAGLVVIVDSNTSQNCWPYLQQQLPAITFHTIEVAAGEQHKTIEVCQQIWQQLFAMQAGRRWCVLNLGGGVIGDMGGFCAGTFKRGIDFIQVPTTLLSQVDASVGGKLGIDFAGVKNSIGLFQDPAAVWADPGFFATLPGRELRSGFAEVLKHALIADAQQWEELETITSVFAEEWDTWVLRSVAIKRDIVQADPHEHGLRKALNFGHTIGHAIESYFLTTEKPLLHGEAIAIGMICEAWLSHQQTDLPTTDLERITSCFLQHFGHQPIPDNVFDTLVATMRQDKKNESAAINFSMLPAIGKVIVNQTATVEAIKQSLAYYNALS